MVLRCVALLLVAGLASTMGEDVDELELIELGDGEGGNPVAANPAPRDYYKIPNKRKAGANVQCNGLFSFDVPTGNLKQCADTCSSCPLCQGFVHSSDSEGKCVWKSSVPDDPCDPPGCKADSYAKCPTGTWSDGVSTSPDCNAPPRGYSKTPGTANCASGGTDIACNDGSVTFRPPGKDLNKCAEMCNKCANGPLKCVGFVRSLPADADEAECRFKSVVPEADAINKYEDGYKVCPGGTWSDGTMTKCAVAPKNYRPRFLKDGGNDIACNQGSPVLSFSTQQGNMTDCGTMCDRCKIGTAQCVGFIRREDQSCLFKSDAATGISEESSVKFAAQSNMVRDAYVRCEENKYSDGTMKTCNFPDDWVTTVSTGGSADCQCNSKPVGDKRFSSATFTFDVFSDRLPVFLSSKPQVEAPCAGAVNVTECARKSDSSMRTSGAGGLPTKVRITASSNDAWCMKKFCISSAKLGRKFEYSEPGSTWLNPGATDDGQCLPSTTQTPDNNWGWCKFVAPGKVSNSSNCNDFNSFNNAFWELPLTSGWGVC